ncbi:MAG: nucleotidyl transferase AbiEii/AbiGii toxin family protein [Candidatus Hydrothermarchaeales archaeon]
MEYDLESLSRTLGFNVREVEKVLRISDLLEDISNVKFLHERLSLYGGTALNFIYFEDIPRLSVDLDFNYRHIEEKDWGEVRDEVEDKIKKLLYMRGYEGSGLRINPSYPLGRIDVSYQNSSGLNDRFIIEIGYMRRYPILREDSEAEFGHIGKKESFMINTPIKEELFANKFGVCFYRTTPRDVYDVYRIAEEDFKRDIFRKCVVIDSLMRGRPALDEIDVTEKINSASTDTSLENLLSRRVNDDFKTIKKKVIEFGESIIEDLTKEEVNLIHEFYEKKKFRPDSIDDKGIFHSKLKENPAILWALKNL